MMLFGIASDFARAGGRTRTVDGRDHVDLSSPGPSFAVASGMVSVFAAARRPVARALKTAIVRPASTTVMAHRASIRAAACSIPTCSATR